MCLVFKHGFQIFCYFYDIGFYDNLSVRDKNIDMNTNAVVNDHNQNQRHLAKRDKDIRAAVKRDWMKTKSRIENIE